MSLNFFDEKEYVRRLIVGGIDPASAAEVASKTAASRKASSQGSQNVKNAAVLIQPSTPAAMPDVEPSPQQVVSSQLSPIDEYWAKVYNHYQEDQVKKTSAGPTEPIRRERMATTPKKKPSPAVAELVDKAHQLEQAAILQATKTQIKELQLSLFQIAPWPDNLRAMPNDLARAALFTVRNKRIPRVARQSHSIFVLSKGVEITYTGVELRAYDDELVWQQVMEYAKRVPVGAPVIFTFYELCTDLGWSINGHYYDKAEECLSRLQATALQFISARLGRLESVSLIHRFRVLDRGKKSSRCQVEIDDDVVVLFAGKYYSKFEWIKYRALSPTARRMFDYFVSHSEPFPMLLESFRLLCGSDSCRPKKWTEQTKIACEELTNSTLVKRAWVEGDKVHCER